MMQSLLENSPDVQSGKRDRLVIVTKETSPASVNQLRNDGIKVQRVSVLDSPYTHNAKFDDRFTQVMTKLKIFELIQYRKIVFIDGDSLVLDSLEELFECGRFCAAFINPCYFNSGLMLITPDKSVYEDMQKKLPVLKSYDGGDQGFLNNYYPNLLNKKSFLPNAEKGRRKKEMDGVRRLPFGWHVDHSSYYPRFAFDFSSKRCGKQRNAEFLGPTFAKPWLWWTYTVMDLSWEWHRHRKVLKDPYPPGVPGSMAGIWRIGVCYVIIALLWILTPIAVDVVLKRSSDLYENCELDKKHMQSFLSNFTISRRSYLLVATLGGFVGWVMSGLVAATVIPPLLMPYHATALFVHVKGLSMFSILVLIGLVTSTSCIAKSKQDAAQHYFSGFRVQDIGGILRECTLWALLDAVFLPLGFKVLWTVTYPTMWNKLIHALLAATLYVVFVLLMCARMSLRWTRLVAYWVETPIS